MANIISSKYVKIRKQRKCFGCTEEQLIGTIMQRCTSKDDDIVTAYWCKECEKIIAEMDSWDRADGFEYGAFHKKNFNL